MKERRDHQAHLVARAGHGGHGAQGIEVEVGVRERDTLGLASGAARVHHGGQVLALMAKVLRGLGLGHQLLVAQHAGRHFAIVAVHQGLEALRGLAQQGRLRREVAVHQQDAGVAVIERVADLGRAPAHVDGVDHATAPPHAVEVLHVADGVQRHHADTVAGLHAQLAQHAGQAGHAVGQLPEAQFLVATGHGQGVGAFAHGLVQGLGQLHGEVSFVVSGA